jgi:DNA anti-recombination protein RmuC
MMEILIVITSGTAITLIINVIQIVYQYGKMNQKISDIDGRLNKIERKVGV